MDFFRTRKGAFGWGIILGFLIWRLCEYVTGESEAWEAGPYLPVALIITGILVSVPCPRHFAFGCGGLYLGQVIGLASLDGGAGADLWILGAILALPLMVIPLSCGAIALAVSHLRKKRKPQR